MVLGSCSITISSPRGGSRSLIRKQQKWTKWSFGDGVSSLENGLAANKDAFFVFGNFDHPGATSSQEVQHEAADITLEEGGDHSSSVAPMTQWL